ncbi:MAG TPA: hypothetical protein VJU86_21060 [Pyrinomonadaceae bacterium]|nr:hypothetical protein [Pyrinomonadaceae bacterium]
MNKKGTRLSVFALVITVALAVVQSPRSNVQSQDDDRKDGRAEALIESARSTSAALDPQTNSLRYISAGGFTEADYTRHVEELKARIKKKLAASGSADRSAGRSSDASSGVSSSGASGESSSGSSGESSGVVPGGTDGASNGTANQFSIVVQKPFVVVGDEPRSVVRQRAEGTVRWAVTKLKQDFFTKDPKEILDIWLFKDEASYEKHAQLFFGEKPTTPYGYYSSTHKALIMNIATGGGTLVHEIVHPFMEANFPASPPWLNEGLGSLYEQSGEVDGHIHGFTNWRLPGLQRAIREKRVPSFKTLTSKNASAFYNDDRGTNYAQSRYLLYYLQEKGVLVKFYKEFVARQKEDPSGYQSLRRVLRVRDMEAFKRKWERYVMGLTQ